MTQELYQHLVGLSRRHMDRGFNLDPEVDMKDVIATASALEGMIMAYADSRVTEALKAEHRLLQHQAFNVLESARAVGQWSELRIKNLEENSDGK